MELELNAADIILNSKAEWNHSKIPRIIIEVGEEREEDCNNGMVRSTVMGGRRGTRRHESQEVRKEIQRTMPREERWEENKERRYDDKPRRREESRKTKRV